MKAIINLLILLILGSLSSYAQMRLRGKVVDELGDPIPSVSIHVVGGTITLTDSLGDFSILILESTGYLVAERIGYVKRTIPYTVGESPVNILLLSADQMIEEVVINTGYQSVPKERATGSFEHINNEILNNMQGRDILERLEGKVAGLQFDNRSGTTSINVRGLNSFSSGRSSPLIVLDNFPFSGDLAELNPNDIESISLLKDAAAASIWGARAGNGVLVINTKKGRVGTMINVTANTFIGQKPDLYYHQPMNSADFIAVEKMLFEQGFYDRSYTSSTRQRLVFSPVIDLLFNHKNGVVSREEVDRKIEGWKSKDYREDLSRYFLQNSINQQYHTAISSSHPTFRYRFGIGYDKRHNSNKGSKDDRISAQLNHEFTPISWVKLESNINYTESASQNSLSFPTYPINPGGGKTSLYPYAELVGQSGEALAIPKNYNFAFIDTAGGGKLLDWKYRPLEDINKSIANGDARYLNANIKLSLALFHSLKAEISYGYELQNSKTSNLYQEESFYASDLINRFTEVNGSNLIYNIPRGDILRSSLGISKSYRTRAQLNYDKRLRSKYQLNAIIGGETSSSDSDDESYGVYGYDSHVRTTQNVNYVFSFPIYGNLAGRSFIPSFDNYGGNIRRFVSLYGNALIQYDQRYSLSLSARQDASNAFGSNVNNRWNPLWSAGMGWIISNENFLKDIDWIDNLKWRSTLGYSGNLPSNVVTRTTIRYLSNAEYTNLPYAMVSSPPNPSLKWETVKMLNLGLDFAFFGNRLTGSIEYYAKKSFDIVSTDPIDPTTGYSSVYRNVGEIKTKGTDINMIGMFANGLWRWNPQVTFSYNKNEVTEFRGSMGATSVYVDGGQQLSPMVGKSMYPVFSYRFAGLDPENGDPQGYLNGEVSKDYVRLLADSIQNLNYHGTALAPCYASFNNKICYGDIEFSFSILFKWGHYFKKETINYYSLFNSWSGHKDYEKRWQNPGDEKETSIPSLIYPANSNRDNFYRNSEANIDKADLVRLQTVRLSYNYHLRASSSKYLNGQLYIGANNVSLIWRKNKWGVDPDFTGLPSPRVITFGINGRF